MLLQFGDSSRKAKSDAGETPSLNLPLRLNVSEVSLRRQHRGSMIQLRTLKKFRDAA